MKKVLALALCLLLLPGVLSGCEARPLPKDTIVSFMDDLRAGDDGALKDSLVEPDFIVSLLNPDSDTPLMRKLTKTVLGGLVYSLGDLRGTYDTNRAVLQLENRDLSVVTARYQSVLAEKETGSEALSESDRAALFSEVYTETEEAVSGEVIVSLTYDTRAGLWKFTVPEDFWTVVLGGEPALLTGLC